MTATGCHDCAAAGRHCPSSSTREDTSFFNYHTVSICTACKSVCMCVSPGPSDTGFQDRGTSWQIMWWGEKSSDGAGITGFTLNMWNRITLSLEDRRRHDISGKNITRSTWFKRIAHLVQKLSFEIVHGMQKEIFPNQKRKAVLIPYSDMKGSRRLFSCLVQLSVYCLHSVHLIYSPPIHFPPSLHAAPSWLWLKL